MYIRGVRSNTVYSLEGGTAGEWQKRQACLCVQVGRALLASLSLLPELPISWPLAQQTWNAGR